jgi:hypothetical protein
MPGKPTPNEIKERRGTLRRDRVLSPSLKGELIQGDIPEPPEGLGELGRAVWGQVLTEASAWVSFRLDTFLLGIVCDQFEERASLRELVIESPDQPRLRIALRELDKALVSNLATLGLTPTDRARLGFVQVRKESKLEQLLKMQEERRATQYPHQAVS